MRKQITMDDIKLYMEDDAKALEENCHEIIDMLWRDSQRLRGALEEINSIPIIEYTVPYLTEMIHRIRPIAREALEGDNT